MILSGMEIGPLSSICCICGKFSKTSTIRFGSKSTDKINQSFATDLLKTKSNAEACQTCASLLESFQRLSEELEIVKEQLLELKRVRGTQCPVSFSTSQVRFITEDLEYEEENANEWGCLNLRLLESEIHLLGEVSETLTSKQINQIGGVFALSSTNGQLEVKSSGVRQAANAAKESSNLFCGHCEESFATLDSLVNHLRAHNKHNSDGKTSFACHICGKAFTRKASMLEHYARHKGVRDKECKVSFTELPFFCIIWVLILFVFRYATKSFTVHHTGAICPQFMLT